MGQAALAQRGGRGVDRIPWDEVILVVKARAVVRPCTTWMASSVQAMPVRTATRMVWPPAHRPCRCRSGGSPGSAGCSRGRPGAGCDSIRDARAPWRWCWWRPWRRLSRRSGCGRRGRRPSRCAGSQRWPWTVRRAQAEAGADGAAGGAGAATVGTQWGAARRRECGGSGRAGAGGGAGEVPGGGTCGGARRPGAGSADAAGARRLCWWSASPGGSGASRRGAGAGRVAGRRCAGGRGRRLAGRRSVGAQPRASGGRWRADRGRGSARRPTPRSARRRPRAGGGRAAAGRAPPPAAKVDLNTATVAQLDTLPGVGPVTAQHIVDWRTRNGRFARVEQLREIDGIGEHRFQQLRELVTV